MSGTGVDIGFCVGTGSGVDIGICVGFGVAVGTGVTVSALGRGGPAISAACTFENIQVTAKHSVNTIRLV